jgi:hypothetical protein
VVTAVVTTDAGETPGSLARRLGSSWRRGSDFAPGTTISAFAVHWVVELADDLTAADARR